MTPSSLPVRHLSSATAETLSYERDRWFESKWGGRPPLPPSQVRIGSAGSIVVQMRDHHDPDQDWPRYRKECLSGSRCRRQGQLLSFVSGCDDPTYCGSLP